jgi:ABC-2 type transport system permease protein
VGAPFSELVLFFFRGFLFWIPLLVGLPAIAMRLLAEERQTGTLETMLTAPVTENQLVVGKYLAALSFFAVLWAPLPVYLALLSPFGTVDWHAAGAGMLGLFLVGAYLLAVALLASALTRNQIIAAIVGFVLVTGLFFIPFLAGLVAHDELARRVAEHLDLIGLLEQFPRGVVDTRHLVYPLSGIVFCLFASARLLEAAKGR